MKAKARISITGEFSHPHVSYFCLYYTPFTICCFFLLNEIHFSFIELDSFVSWKSGLGCSRVSFLQLQPNKIFQNVDVLNYILWRHRKMTFKILYLTKVVCREFVLCIMRPINDTWHSLDSSTSSFGVFLFIVTYSHLVIVGQIQCI